LKFWNWVCAGRLRIFINANINSGAQRGFNFPCSKVFFASN
jgi:hypothetical protein